MESVVVSSGVLSRLRRNAHQCSYKDSELELAFQFVYVFLEILFV